jgi:CRISPR system Cascade subunit CasE
MYYSRLTLNPRNAQVRSELARPYEMHRTLSHAFEDGTFEVNRATDESSGVLFRVDEQPRESSLVVLVQSKIAPDWLHLSERKDARGQPYLLRPAEFKVVNLQLAAGQMLSFRLRANPTKRLGNSAGDGKGKRVGIYAEDKQLEWLQRKAESGGFRVLRAQISRDERLTDEIHPHDHETHALKLLTVQFDGVLQVIDAPSAQHTIEGGIGSGKGFGCGLLSLAPASQT